MPKSVTRFVPRPDQGGTCPRGTHLPSSRARPTLLPVLLVLALTGCSSLWPFGGESKKKEEPGVAQLYKAAKEELDNGNYEQAVKKYEALEARYPYGVYAQQAELEMAYAQYKQGESSNAVATADRFIKAHPNQANIDYAYYVKGLANFKDDFGYFSSLSGQDLAERDIKAARESFDTFKELITRFPLSRYAEDSGRRLVYLQNNLANHEVYVADYYYRRGAWLASVNRAQIVVKDYPRAPAAEKALFLMVRDYHQLGLPDLEADSLLTLKRNFPNSPLLNEAATDQPPWWQVWKRL